MRRTKQFLNEASAVPRQMEKTEQLQRNELGFSGLWRTLQHSVLLNISSNFGKLHDNEQLEG